MTDTNYQEDTANSLMDRVYGALRLVIDPEIGLDIVTLGLVYNVEINGDVVDITFSLTTPGCPMEHAIRGGILQAVGQVEGIGQVRPNLVWEPRWDPSRVEPGAL
jgi:metal-sulfur cluster biosynthetic enzyme